MWQNLNENIQNQTPKEIRHNSVKCVIHGITYLFFIPFEPQHDKTNKMTAPEAKTQISLGIRPVWSVFAVRSVGS